MRGGLWGWGISEEVGGHECKPSAAGAPGADAQGSGGREAGGGRGLLGGMGQLLGAASVYGAECRAKR